jgi:hypothetical protein
LLCGVPGAFELHAQDFELAVEPDFDGERVPSCASEIILNVWLRNATPAVPAGGYQLYLRFPAEHFTALRFDSLAIDAAQSTLYIAGPPPLGDGFIPCSAQGQGGEADLWDDGQGDDVVAVLATVLGDPGAGPLSAEETLLGHLVFRPTGVLAAPGEAAFSMNHEACIPPFSQTTRVFDMSGNALAASATGDLALEIVEAAEVQELSCTLHSSDSSRAVELSWQISAGGALGIEALRIYRDGGQIAVLNAAARTFTDESTGELAAASYAVAPLFEGGVEGCGASCDVSLISFIRGDADRNGRLNVSDAVAILRFSFQGGQLPCEDAADADDTGTINLTDGIYVLRWLFVRSAPPPPPPFPDAGVDPTTTDDNLGCAG